MCYPPTWGTGWAHCCFAAGTLKEFNLRSNSRSILSSRWGQETVREEDAGEIPHIRQIIKKGLDTGENVHRIFTLHCISCRIRWHCPVAESLGCYDNVTKRKEKKESSGTTTKMEWPEAKCPTSKSFTFELILDHLSCTGGTERQ